ncbi:MAG TPA: DEAD/DEAH box helicase [Candidatus Xenobia bacterium]
MRTLPRPPRAETLVEALGAFLDRGRANGCITHVETLPPRPARHRAWPEGVPAPVREAYARRGIDQPYGHQSQAIESVLAGRHTVVVTPTASGKTLCYNAPVLTAIVSNPSARALYLFPTKALSQDQLAELQTLSEGLATPVRTWTYDGDTPDDARRAIRAQGHIVVTNPDMLHTGILPHHARWARLFENLKYVVIDELHAYRGVFGSHLCNCIRRLKRICAFYGSSPVFIMSSATIANPQELASRLTEADVALVDENGAPSGEKQFVFYNPPVLNAELGIRQSYLKATRRIASTFIEVGAQTIVFAMSRLSVEVLTTYLKERHETKPGQQGLIRGYRGGYLPTVRREIEKGLRDGSVKGVVSTNALELGIDIGHLDVSVMAGYPGSVASAWQQAGRAGRRSGRSVVVLVSRSDPMDQYIIQHPEYFFERAPEYARINPDNLLILVSHVKCAAFELPFHDGERFGAAEVTEILQYLEEEKVVHHAGGKWYWNQEVYPADAVSLRSVSNENFVIMDMDAQNRVIAEVDYKSAPSTVYPDAIYLCEGQPYNVKHLDYEQHRAYVRKVEVEYYTEAITNTSVEILDIFESDTLPHAVREHGEVHVAWRVSGFKKIKFASRENVGYGEVKLPDQEMQTTSYWFTVSQTTFEGLGYSRSELLDGVVGIAYLLHAMAPMYLMCDSGDIARCVGDRKGRWFATDRRKEDVPGLLEADHFEPTVFLYDNYPGGIGFSPQLWDLHATLLKRALEVVDRCACQCGCPSCVGPTNEVGVRAREVATALLRRLTT